MNELIQVLIVYLASVGFSCAFLIAAVVKVIKHLLDNGYILNMNKANEHKSDPTLLTVSLLIPVYNIVFSAKHYNDTMKEMPYVLNAFKVGDFLDELTEEQKRRYNENPSFLEVMKILLEQKENDISNFDDLQIKNDDDYYKLVKDITNLYKSKENSRKEEIEELQKLKKELIDEQIIEEEQNNSNNNVRMIK